MFGVLYGGWKGKFVAEIVLLLSNQTQWAGYGNKNEAGFVGVDTALVYASA